MKMKLNVPALLCAALLLAGCASSLTDPETATPLTVSTAADMAAEYSAIRASEMAAPDENLINLDAQTSAALLAEYDAADETARAIDALVRSGEDIVVEDLGDGTVKVTRTWSVDDETTIKNVVVRPTKPLASDTGFVNGELTQNGSEQRFVNDVKTADMTVTIVWKLENESVYRYRLAREGEKFKLNGAFTANTVSEWDSLGALVSKTVSYVKPNLDGIPTVRTFTFTEVEIDGQTWRKIVSSDQAGYAIIKSTSPRIVEYYEDDGMLRLVVTHERVAGSGIVITREYWNNDSLVRTVTGSMRVSTTDGVITMKRSIGDKTFIATLEETDTGYLVTRDGVGYSVTFNADGTVTVQTDTSAWLVEYAADGSAVVTAL